MTTLASRLAVILAGLPVALGCAYLGGWFLFALTAVAALIALHELYRLARSLRPLVLAGYGGAFAALLGAELGGPGWMLAGFLLTFPFAFVFAAVAETRQSTTVAVATTVLGAAWVGLGLAHLLLIRQLERVGLEAILTVLVTVFAIDTFAYIGGRIAGRHKMTPVMSPGKTWEGFAAGAVAGVLAAFFALYDSGFADGWRSLALGAALVLATTLGDLFESAVQRDLGAKDSGRLLLGHGGLLDRIDSLLFAGPVAYFVLLAIA